MTVVKTLPLTCDQCRKPMDKAKKVHDGLRYCATCYPRLFKRRICSGCGNFARLHVEEKQPKCRKCELLAPCVRCSRVGRPVGMITPFGPACNSCAHYYKEPEPCEVCGVPSTRLTRVLKIDPNVRCCPSCARKGFATCPNCRRHRVLTPGENGVALCRACTEQGEIRCETCHEPMPAGRGKQCEACSWKKAFERRLRVNVEMFELQHTRRLFIEFGQWLEGHLGAHRAFLRLLNYMPFFDFLTSQPSGIPSYISLLEHFHADGIRKMKTPMLWLKEAYGVEADPLMRENHSEKRRIEELLRSVPNGTASSALGKYHASLMMKVAEGTTTLRSVRLSLRAAVGVLAEASSSLDVLPTQESVRHYLSKTPGQKAAAQGFISYLNRTLGLDLDVTVSKRTLARVKREKLEHELTTMLGSGGSGEAFERSWIKVALMFFHGLTSINKKSLLYDRVSMDAQEGFQVQLGDKEYWVPVPDDAGAVDFQAHQPLE